MFEAIGGACQYYYDEFPKEVVPTVCKSALFSFTATLIYTSYPSNSALNVARALFAAGLAALASLVHALITPLFKGVFGNNFKFIQEYFKFIFVGISLSILVDNFTNSKVNLYAVKMIPLLSLNFLKSIPYSVLNFSEWLNEHMGNNPNFRQENDLIRAKLRAFGFEFEGFNSIYFTIG